ncbi:MAG: UDP-glucose/GDP-mannose dehydrogenase family protein [Bacteriovoracales bacterium]|nr:UDP-glucose/GDP-mannose dehydrogenase family protein [Bacteriovoracales bacterium]
MEIAVVGTGYVGLVTGVCLAEMGHHITCIDIDREKIAKLQNGQSPLYELGLDELLTQNQKRGRLHFTTDYHAVSKAKAVFLAVGTPTSPSGQADLRALMEASTSVAQNMGAQTVIVIKSTVPVGTGQRIKELIKKHTDKTFYVVNNPEFLREGTAVKDFMNPDRIVIGYEDAFSRELLTKLYAPLIDSGHPLHEMSNASAEMAKYASNSFLATKISFINDMAKLCERVGADIEDVQKTMGTDPRIGKHFLFPGIGYGGSCFPKDIKALIHTAREREVDPGLLTEVEKINQRQKLLAVERIKARLGDLKGKTIALWGVSFKPHTDDVREAPSLTIAKKMIEEGGKVQFYDPVAKDRFLTAMGESKPMLKAFDDMYECLRGAQALILATEWPEFKNPDLKRMKECLEVPIIFDGRNIYSTEKMLAAGFSYEGIGKRII